MSSALYIYLFLQISFISVAVSARIPNWLSSLPQLPKSGWLTAHQSASINASDYSPSWMTIPVHHFNSSDTRTFQNRFWANSTFHEAGGPVFWYDAGEQDAQLLVPYKLNEILGPSAVMTLARRFKGLALVVEHRYYGNTKEGSYPYPINSATGELLDPTGYKYLNTEQALEDAVYFAHTFDAVSGLNVSLAPTTTPWIWLGGSYSGVRGAQLRVRNPETFFATWASTAPTEAGVDMWTYYAQAERSMARNCSADFTAVTRYVDGILANETRKKVNALKRQLLTAKRAAPSNLTPVVGDEDIAELDNAGVGFLLLNPFKSYQYYGVQHLVAPFCDVLETRNRINVSTTDNGGVSKAIAPASGLALEHNIKMAWHAFLVALAEMDNDAIESPTLDDQVGSHSWKYQYCSEYGYYLRGNPENPHTIQSQFISLDYRQAKCNNSFPGLLPPSPNVTAPNVYGGWRMQPSNTMFTTGQYDPWRAYSPASIEEGSPQRRTTQVIPKCGQSPVDNDVFGIIYDGMVHVSDMQALLDQNAYYHHNFSTVGFSSPISTEPFFAGTGLFERALEAWLPCFGQIEAQSGAVGGPRRL